MIEQLAGVSRDTLPSSANAQPPRQGYADGETDSAPLLFLRKPHSAHTADCWIMRIKEPVLPHPSPRDLWPRGGLPAPFMLWFYRGLGTSHSASRAPWEVCWHPSGSRGQASGCRWEPAQHESSGPRLTAGGGGSVIDCADLISSHQGLWKASLGELCAQLLVTRRPIPHRGDGVNTERPPQVSSSSRGVIDTPSACPLPHMLLW